MDVFFVISGFVATLSVEKYLKSGRSGLSFLLNRALRIYLGYWPFYFFALVLAPLGRKKMVIFTGAVLLLLFCLLFFPGARGGSFFVLVSFFGEFLLGFICFAFASTNHFSSIFKAGLALFFIACGLCVGLSFDADIGPLRFFGFGLFSFGLVLFFVLLEKDWGVVFNQFLVALGSASYTIYLCHTLFFEVFKYFSARISIDYRWMVDLPVWAMLALLSIVCFSILYFRCVERPIYRGVSAFFRLQD